MKIAFDLTQIPLQKTGIGIYAYYMIQEICKINQKSFQFQLFFFLQDDDQQLLALVNSGKNQIKMPVRGAIFRNLLCRFFFEQIYLPVKCRQLGIDIIYSFHYTIPLFSKKHRVVNIPDMTFYLFPELHRRFKVFYFRYFIPKSLNKCSKVITISHSTKADILSYFSNVDPQKIEVIYLGANLGISTADARNLDDTMKRYGLEKKKYILFVGTLEPRKNVVGIINSFHILTNSQRFRQSPLKLVLVGKKGWFYEEIFSTVEKLGLADRVVFTGYVSENEKKALLKQALVFLYPSFYEGFGIPVIEAMAQGVPVVTSNISSLPEVVGNAALKINPYEITEMALAVEKLLTDDDLYQDLLHRGLRQSEKFTWQKTATETLKLLASIKISGPGGEDR